jgi:hypothetical protein
VGDVEAGRSLPNAEEILAYAVVFGFCGKAIFPRYYAQVEEAVMQRAYSLSEELKPVKTPAARKKCLLISQMFARATGKSDAKAL